MNHPFALLAVCTGNICRSPVVERLLVDQLGPSVKVQSAGTRALVGEPIEARMAQLLTEQGGSPDGFAARQLGEADVRESELVVALTRHHRARVVELWPGAVRRSFTLRELARIVTGLTSVPRLGATPGERLAHLIRFAAAARAEHPAKHPLDDDVVDPYLRPDECYGESMRQIVPAVQAIVAAVR